MHYTAIFILGFVVLVVGMAFSCGNTTNQSNSASEESSMTMEQPTSGLSAEQPDSDPESSGTQGEALQTSFQTLIATPSESYKTYMTEAKHHPDFPVPPALQDFITAFQPVRMGLVMGWTWEPGQSTFFWMLPEFGVLGDASEATEQMQTRFREHGFAVIPDETLSYGFRMEKTDSTVLHRMQIRDFDDWIGGSERRSGGTMLYEIILEQEIPELTLEQVLTAIPFIRCSELPESLESWLNSKLIHHIDYGGTWTRYYDWMIEVPLKPNESWDGFHTSLVNFLEQEGFSYWKTSRGTEIYERREPEPSFFYVESVEKGSQTYAQLRYQPHS